MLNLGINLNNRCGENDEQVLANIKSAGFENVMMCYKAELTEQIIENTKKLGLNVPYFHLDNTDANDLWVMGANNENYVASVIQQIKLCGKYNIPIAIMHTTYGSPTDLALKPNKHGLSCMNKILKVAKKCNVKIALENVDKSSLKHISYLFSNIKSQNLGFCYDVGHHHLYYPKTNLIKKYKDKLLAVHLHDNLMDWQLGHDFTRDLHLLPFDGKVDYNKVIARLKKANYNGILMLEVRKRSIAKPHKYVKWSDNKYLSEAYKRVMTINEMLGK